MYRNRARSDNPPHVFAMADAAYHAMLHQRRSQCIVISGESGAGLLKKIRLFPPLPPTFRLNFLFLVCNSFDRQNGHGQFSPQTTRHLGQGIPLF